MGGAIPKQLMQLGGKPVYQYSLETFLNMEEIAEVVIAVPADWKDYFEKDIFSRLSPAFGTGYGNNLNKLRIVVGGKERWQSVQNGVNALTSGAEYVLVHDVARPFISEKIIRDVCETLVNVSKAPLTATKFGLHRHRKQPASICSRAFIPASRRNR